LTRGKRGGGFDEGEERGRFCVRLNIVANQEAEFERLKPEFAFLDQVLSARQAAGLTQADNCASDRNDAICHCST